MRVRKGLITLTIVGGLAGHGEQDREDQGQLGVLNHS